MSWKAFTVESHHSPEPSYGVQSAQGGQIAFRYQPQTSGEMVSRLGTIVCSAPTLILSKDAPAMKLVCLECLTDPYLRKQIPDKDPGDCSYCGQESPVIELEELVVHCKGAILSFFQVVEQSMGVIHYGRDPVGHSLATVLDRILRAPAAVIDDLAADLLDRWDEWGDDDPYFMEQTLASSHLESEWNQMERSLRDEARFVNPFAAQVLEKVFGSIEQFFAADATTAILTVGPGQPIHTFQRARVFSDEEAMTKALLHPERHLGPPPAGIGAAGRMNAKGVSVFYGATSAETAIAEVRPSVGSIVVTAEFEVIRPLRLLNLEQLSLIQPNNGLSYFEPMRLAEAERCAFFKALKDRLLMPVMPELVDQGYLITQAIADFLSMHHTLAVDGIFFPSVQTPQGVAHTDGHNVILFNKACAVLRSESKHAASSVSLWEREEDYTLYRPEIWASKGASHPSRRWGDEREMEQMESSKKLSLELNRNQIRTHHVDGVKFSTKTESVEYHPGVE